MTKLMLLEPVQNMIIFNKIEKYSFFRHTQQRRKGRTIELGINGVEEMVQVMAK